MIGDTPLVKVADARVLSPVVHHSVGLYPVFRRSLAFRGT